VCSDHVLLDKCSSRQLPTNLSCWLQLLESILPCYIRDVQLYIHKVQLHVGRSWSPTQSVAVSCMPYMAVACNGCGLNNSRPQSVRILEFLLAQTLCAMSKSGIGTVSFAKIDRFRLRDTLAVCSPQLQSTQN
jgi:hypothetical protein